MIPYKITVANAAAPQASLSFLFWGAGPFVLPVIALYTAAVYWLLRGKLRPAEAYPSGIDADRDDAEGKTMAGVTRHLHHMVVVGGGAGGLELATHLGDKLGRREPGWLPQATADGGVGYVGEHGADGTDAEGR
jgi:hypothetical protein